MKLVERFAILLTSASALAFGSVHAAQWQLSQGIDLSVGVVGSETKSVAADPIGTVAADVDDSTDRTLTITPYIAASRESRRLSFSGRAGLVYRSNSGEPDAEVEPSGFLQATGVLLEDKLWLESDGSIARRLVGSNNIVDDALTNPDEAVEVYQFSIGPRWEQDLSRTVRAGGAYRYGLIDGSGSEVAGSDAHMINLSLLRALNDGVTRLGIQMEAQRTYFDTGNTARAEALIAGISYDFKRNLTGSFLFGRDRLESTTQEFDEQGNLYGIGITWQPLRQVHIDAEYQERAFGSKPAVSIGVQGRVSSVEFSWSREASLTGGFALNGSSVFGDSSPDTLEPETLDTSPSVDAGQVTNLATFASESQNVIEEIAIEYQLRTRMSVFLARISHLEGQLLAESGNSRANTVLLSFNRSLSRRLQLAFTVSATDEEKSTSDDVSTDKITQQALITLRLTL